MALQVTSGGSGQLYGGAPNYAQVAAPVKQSSAYQSNFTNTFNPTVDPSAFINGFNQLHGNTSAPSSPQANTPVPLSAADQQAQAQAAADNQAKSLALGQNQDQQGQLRAMLQNDIPQQLQNGITQLENDYNKNYSRSAQDQATAQAGYDTKIQDTTRGQQTALDRVNQSANSLANSVRGIIGRASGSGSSAYQITAPQAVIQQASNDRTGVQDTFGTNFRNLDTAKKDADTQYQRLFQDLSEQRQQKEGGLRSGIQQQQNGIQGQLADLARQQAALNGGDINAIRSAGAPYQNTINQGKQAIQDITQRFATPYSVQAPNLQAPQLSDYLTKNAAMQQSPEQAAATTGFLPKQQQDDQQLQPIF